MQTQAGDSYVRQLASYIRTNAPALAEAAFARRRTSSPSPLGWLSPLQRPPQPLVLAIDTHHLFYILIRLDGLGIRTGPLDVHVQAPSRPTSYKNIYPNPETLSLASFRSSLSSLSLPTSWWSLQPPPSLDADLKFIYSSFTKLPALAISAPGQKAIAELIGDSPDTNAIPLDVFKNLQRLECENIDPRILLGWDLLSVSLRSIKIRKSGLQNVSQVFIDSVLADQARRHPTPDLEQDPPPHKLPSASWAFLKHLYLPDNGLTSFPPELLPYLTSVTHLDLSSNLFVSVPSGLEELYNLTSLNLSDNIIDSVLGIYLNLGQLLHLNLSRNRLESICGLERLLALERVDLRHNLLEESSEIGRLAALPNIAELWIEGNPLVELEDSYRINCFAYFSKEGKTILLDGTSPTMYERRSLNVSEQAKPILPSSSSSTPVIAIEPLHEEVLISPAHSRRKNEASSGEAPRDTASVVASARRQKKPKRIVDLDSSPSHQMFPSASHSRLGSIQVMSTSPERVDEEGPLRRSRHGRYQTEYIPPSESIYPSGRSEARRARQSASVFEGSGEGEETGDVEAYRKTIESLKKDMGESWLKVYNQTQA